MLKKFYLLAIAFSLIITNACSAAVWYIADSTPWGQTFDSLAMDNVYGPGNWTNGNYSTPAASIFTPATLFVMLEGSDQNANALNTFLTTNIATIENWVAAGGHLFVNAAPNQGGDINFGFNGTVLNYAPYYSTTGHAVDSTNAIFLGPYTPVATSYTGNYFSHAVITGTGLTNLLYGAANTSIVLAMESWGAGTVFFGALSQPNWWSPQPEAQNLWYNIISSVAVPLSCTSPDSLSVTNITTDGGTFHWTGTATTYEFLVDASAASPAGNGDSVMTDTVVVTGLQSDSTYYFHVRAVCDSSNKSAWVTIQFTTAHLNTCAAPTGYATVSFTQVSPYATLHWSGNATQYFWVLDTTATNPTVNGNATTDTTISFANLLANKTYYFHVRCICPNGDTSSWTTISFFTASCQFPTASATINETPVGPYANINWAAPTAASYLWVLDHDSTNPAAPGNMTTNTSMSFASLATGADYWFHVRAICTNGDTSVWVTIMFHTPGQPTSVSNATNDGTTVICSPNPTTDKITISITGAIYDNASITLSSLDGRVLYNVPVTGNKAVVDMRNLPAALYFIKYTNKDYSSIIKVMKQ